MSSLLDKTRKETEDDLTGTGSDTDGVRSDKSPPKKQPHIEQDTGTQGSTPSINAA